MIYPPKLPNDLSSKTTKLSIIQNKQMIYLRKQVIYPPTTNNLSSKITKLSILQNKQMIYPHALTLPIFKA